MLKPPMPESKTPMGAGLLMDALEAFMVKE
jgi:hypothetical protein